MGLKSVDPTTSWFIYSFSFVINFPHFLASYHLLYWDFRDRAFSNYRYLTATVLAPAILAGLLIYGLVKPDADLLGYILSSMFFFVGWHYIKQTFGVLSVCNVQEKIFFNREEQTAIKAFLYAIWAVSWISMNSSGALYSMEGVPYPSFNLPPLVLNASYTFLAVSGANCLWMAYLKYVRDGVVISVSGLVSIIALLAWNLPVLFSPIYFLLVPMFHSLQYLYFVWLVKSNQAANLTPIVTEPEQRRVYFKNFYGYLLLPIITGSIFMWFLPKGLDFFFPLTKFEGANPFMLAFTVFINIHHYFIDHAIWRHDNPTMKNYLFVAQKE